MWKMKRGNPTLWGQGKVETRVQDCVSLHFSSYLFTMPRCSGAGKLLSSWTWEGSSHKLPEESTVVLSHCVLAQLVMFKSSEGGGYETKAKHPKQQEYSGIQFVH